MRFTPRVWAFVGCLGVAVAGGALGACSAESDDAVSPLDLDGDAGGSDGAGNIEPSIAKDCRSAAECNGSVCHEGKCCAPTAICGTSCCGDGTMCLLDKCVVPGKTCQSASDCSPTEYCEPALGAGAGTPPPTTDAACVAAPPASGRCVAKPVVCDDAGAPQGCVASCEYMPPVGPLDIRMQWAWGDNLGPDQYPNHVDVWSTPVVGRLHDGNCDGKVDELDPPSVVFVSGDNRAEDAGASQTATCCQCTGKAESACQTGVLRMVDGASGKTIWSLARDPGSSGSKGFAGVSPALGDIDGDGRMEIVVATGDGFVSIIDAKGQVMRRSDLPIETGVADNAAFGWGGGLALADMDGDGAPEIAYGRTVFTTKDGALKRLWVGKGGVGGGNRNSALSTFAELRAEDGGGGGLELLAGRTAYQLDGGMIWNRTDLRSDGGVSDGFPAIADLDKNGRPEAVVVADGRVFIIDASSGAKVGTPFVLAETTVDGDVDDALGFGGPPTIADFDGDGFPDIGVATSEFFFVLKTVRSASGKITGLSKLWSHANHDLSSSQTGSTVFDFEGDGKAEVVYADECFLWVWGFEGGKPVVRLTIPTTSFTGTESQVVADVDGDGHAELLIGANRADPSATRWKCNVAPWNQPDPATGRVAWTPPPGAAPGTPYRGLRLYGDRENAWVGTRTLWNQHTYHVTNICDPRDSACQSGTYGSIPAREQTAWSQPWLNSFRQNVQQRGLFDAPDAVVSLRLDCTKPATGRVDVRNVGLKALPAGVRVAVYEASTNKLVQEVTTKSPLLPGQTETLGVTAGDPAVDYQARIVIDPQNRTFRQCREDNDQTPPTRAACAK